MTRWLLLVVLLWQVGLAAVDLKVIVGPDVHLPSDVSLIADYGSYRLYRISAEQYAGLSPSARAGFRLVDMDLLRFSNHTFATSAGEPDIPQHLRILPGNGHALHLIQFSGPIRDEWLAQVRATGALPVHYIADNGYLVWVGAAARSRLDQLASSGIILQYSRPFHTYFKLGPELFANEVDRLEGVAPLVVTIQVLDHAELGETQAIIEAHALERFTRWQPILGYRNIVVLIPAAAIVPIAARPDVVWVGLRQDREMHDEVQAQILAGALDQPQMGPNAPGYLSFLLGLGFSPLTQTYPLIEIVDDGLGNGTVLSGDPTLHRFGDLVNPSRLISVTDCSSAASGAGDHGHGHLNASIAAGYDTRSGAPYQDGDGYNLGMGVNPYAPLAGTRIFNPGFDLSACSGSEIGLIQASFRSGVRISNNSWGCRTCTSVYDESAQAYDVGVRDADQETPGNQQMTFIFSAGNAGPGSATVSSPGNGKNIITVGASESDRPTWIDGCGWGPEDADNAMEIASFSGRGPAPGNRVKPDLVAPGTHIQGTASTSAEYDGFFICDPFQPPEQTVFAASSGTSHAAPAITGLASLVYWWLVNRLQPVEGGYEPSPAAIKAYLLAHAGTYLTGTGAGDNLPSHAQGYGMPNIATCFDDADRLVLDQTEILDNSGDTFTLLGTVPDADRPLRVVLAYTDAAGLIGTEPMVNNLDLELRLGNLTYRGNRFAGAWSVPGGGPDSTNNAEAVFLPSGVTGTVAIQVTGFNIAGDGVPGQGDATDQDFSLVVYNFDRIADFSLAVSPTLAAACSPADAGFEISLGQVLGFDEPVSLSVTNLPAGMSAIFDANPVMPPTTANLTLETDQVAPGTYALDVTATASTGAKTRRVVLVVDDVAPAPPALVHPLDGAVDRARQFLELAWSAVAQAGIYEVELATDPGFAELVSVTSTAASTVVLDQTLDPLTTYYWRVRARNSCGSGSYSTTYSFRTFLRADYFTELFEDGNDLAYRRLLFIPDGSGNYFRACTTAAMAFPTDPSEGTVLNLSDDGSQVVRPKSSITYYEVIHDAFYIGANGYVTFGSGDSIPLESYQNHFDLPRISALFDDLDPSSGGTVSWRETGDRIAVTFEDVPEQGLINGNNFQIEMFFNGEMSITFLALAANDGLVGLSRGQGPPFDFEPSDLSALPGDVNGDGIVDGADFTLAVSAWAQEPPLLDYNGNGSVDATDLVVLLNLAGQCP